MYDSTMFHHMICPHCRRFMQTLSLSPPSYYCSYCYYQATFQFMQGSSAETPSWAYPAPAPQQAYPFAHAPRPRERTDIPPGIRRAFAYEDLLAQTYEEEQEYEEEGQ